MVNLCLNNCGFFSGSNAEGLCSLCFKQAFPEAAAKEQAAKEQAAKVAKAKEESNKRGTRRAARAEQSNDPENNVKVLTYSTVEYGGVVSRVVMQVGNNPMPAKQTLRRPRRTEEEREAVKAKRREERKVLKSAFASMLILISATFSIFGLVPACILLTTSTSFFFHSRQQRIKRKAEKQGGGGEEDATEKEKTETLALAETLPKEEEEKTADDTGIKFELKKARKVRCKVITDVIQQNSTRFVDQNMLMRYFSHIPLPSVDLT